MNLPLIIFPDWGQQRGWSFCLRAFISSYLRLYNWSQAVIRVRIRVSCIPEAFPNKNTSNQQQQIFEVAWELGYVGMRNRPCSSLHHRPLFAIFFFNLCSWALVSDHKTNPLYYHQRSFFLGVAVLGLGRLLFLMVRWVDPGGGVLNFELGTDVRPKVSTITI